MIMKKVDKINHTVHTNVFNLLSSFTNIEFAPEVFVPRKNLGCIYDET